MKVTEWIESHPGLAITVHPDSSLEMVIDRMLTENLWGPFPIKDCFISYWPNIDRSIPGVSLLNASQEERQKN